MKSRSGRPRLNRELRGDLLRLDRLDAALRSQWVESEFKDRALERKLQKLNAAGIDWLREVLALHGWPGRSLVGPSAAEAASRLIQHAECALAFQRRCLRLVEEAAARGEVPPRHVAYLTDVVRMRAGRKQLFGTKFRKVKGELVPCPIEKPAEVDARRRRMELEPLDAYARRLRRSFAPSPDWDAFARRHWEKAPARLSLGRPVLPPRSAFRNVVEASAPFRFGTRFRALPDVRFFVGDGRMSSPGNLLPGARDRDVEGYVRRVSARLGQPFQVLVEQPFLLDFALWDGARSFLEGLLGRVGVPVLPIVTQVVLGDFPRAPPLPPRPHHSLLTLVLHGRMRVRLGGKRARTLEAEAGDVLYVPSRLSSQEECQGPCLAVRLWIPVRGNSPTEAVKDVLVTLLDTRLPPGHAVPYLDYPWRPSRRGAVASAAPLLSVAGAMEELTRGPDLLSALRIVWARRVSACGLEPAPAPHDAPPLQDSTLVRAAPRHRVVRMLDSPGQWIWAINGHAFPMEESPEAQQVLEALASGDALRVDALCRVARRAPQRARLRALLETLHALRAIEVVAGKGG